MFPVFLLKAGPWLIVAAVIVFVVYRTLRQKRGAEDGYGRREKVSPPVPRRFYLVSASLVIFLGLVGLFFSSATWVPATHIAVVENTAFGSFDTLRPGIHIWPFDPRIPPLFSKIESYNLRRQIIEIGSEPAKEGGIQADSNSPGRPVVYFYARGWALANPEKIIELHRKYGPNYLDDWVERNWVSSLKAIQGGKPYDYVGNYRVKMQNEVEAGLREQLLGDDGEPLVIVSQLAIVDFDYEDKITAYLDSVAQKEFERQQQEQQIQINMKQQEAAKIEVETTYITTKRTAEAEQAAAIARAEGDAKAKKLMADAVAYEIKAKYQAEAGGIGLVTSALANAPSNYTDYIRATRWNGEWPKYWFGGGPMPFFNVPTEPE